MKGKNVYILGAGFSHAQGLPLQDDFLSQARDVYFSNPDAYKHFEKVFNFFDKLSRMRNYLSYPLLNLENLFNLFEMELFYSIPKDNSKKRDFIKLIVDVLKKLSKSPTSYNKDGGLQLDDGGSYGLYLKFLRLFMKPQYPHNVYADTIISLNYDLIVESVTHLHNLEAERGDIHNHIFLNVVGNKENIKVLPLESFFDTPQQQIYDDLLEHPTKTINLLKLHGSINWEKQNGENFIIPPTWNKSDATVHKLWKRAHEAITKANRIIFIGYSLPETDTYIKSLLALGINKNDNLQNIYFINPDKTEVKQRALSLLDRHFIDYCDYKEWTFEELMESREGKKFIRDKLKRHI